MGNENGSTLSATENLERRVSRRHLFSARKICIFERTDYIMKACQNCFSFEIQGEQIKKCLHICASTGDWCFLIILESNFSNNLINSEGESVFANFYCVVVVWASTFRTTNQKLVMTSYCLIDEMISHHLSPYCIIFSIQTSRFLIFPNDSLKERPLCRAFHTLKDDLQRYVDLFSAENFLPINFPFA